MKHLAVLFIAIALAVLGWHYVTPRCCLPFSSHPVASEPTPAGIQPLFSVPGGASFGGDIVAEQGGGVSRPTPFSVKPEEDEDGNTFCPFGYDKHLAVEKGHITGNFTCTATPAPTKLKAKPASPSYLTYKVSDGYAVHCKGLSYAYDGAWFEPPLKKDAESYCKVWRFLSKEQSGPSALTHFLAAPGLGIPKSSTDDFPKKHAMEHKEGYTLWGDAISGIYVAPLPIECPDYASCI